MTFIAAKDRIREIVEEQNVPAPLPKPQREFMRGIRNALGMVAIGVFWWVLVLLFVHISTH